MYWTSLTVQKEIVPATHLYYPKRVGSSPYNVTIDKGPTIASEVTATAAGIESAVAGKLSYIKI